MIAEEAFSEIEERWTAIGATTTKYPFRLGTQSLSVQRNASRTPYIFMLLLSRYGKSAGPKGLFGERIFEDVSEVAARTYFGGTTGGAQTFPFGFPRRRTVAGFVPALRDLCVALGEGREGRRRPSSKKQKDAKLDLVAWRPFADERPGQLIGFGQCATGSDWTQKLSELQPTAFCKKWLADQPAHDPVRLYFVPFRVDADEWDERTIDAGILFDRCRIASLAAPLPAALRRDCHRWTAHVLRTRLR